MFNKKGVSPLIATILLVAFTIVLAAVIINWAGTLSKQQMEKMQIESRNICLREVDVNIKSVCYEGENIKFTAENLKSRDIIGFLVVFKDVTSEPAYADDKGLSGFGKKTFSVLAPSGVKKIGVMPVIKINDKEWPCSNKVMESDVKASCA